MSDLIAELAEVVRLSVVATQGNFRALPFEFDNGPGDDSAWCVCTENSNLTGCDTDKTDAELFAAAVNFIRTHHATLIRIIESEATLSADYQAMVIRLGEVTAKLEAAERDARVTKRSAETLCRIYFEIAAEAVGEDKVRAERDRRIHATQEGAG